MGHCSNGNQKKKSNDDEPPLNIDGKTTNDYENIANIFNTYFTTVTDKTSANNSMIFNVTSNAVHRLNYLHQVLIRQFPNIKLTPASTKEVSEIIKSFKWKNSHGYNEIPIKLLKISLPYIISPLTYIRNRSWSTGIFPTRSKFSQINPIFKKGNKAEISNYRPISLLTYLSEVFEKFIYKRLSYHVNSNNILPKEQYGFRNNSSTEIASFNLINNILIALNNKKWVGGIFL
jgi:hypothetical protein